MHASSQNQRPAALERPHNRDLGTPVGLQLAGARAPPAGRSAQRQREPGCGTAGPRDARPREASWISKDRFPGNLARAAGDPGGPVLGPDLARVLRARSRASLLGARLPLRP